jgi:hypothetical protein
MGTLDKEKQSRERVTEQREGIVRDPGEPRADAPSDLPEGDVPHPQDVNEFGYGKRKPKPEDGPTGSVPR